MEYTEIIIKIPKKEFGVDIEDKFQDFFKRLEVEIKHHMISETNLVCGTYELETIQMFMQALANGTPLPKGHGRLGDLDAVMSDISTSINELTNIGIAVDGDYLWEKLNDAIYNAAPIIEADRSDVNYERDR